MDLVLGYLAGLLTVINPCVLPVLPIALASSISSHRYGPLALAAGMSVAFTAVGVFVSSIGPAVGLDAELISRIAAALMIGFGLILLVPQANARFALATAGVSGRADEKMGALDWSGLPGQFAGGLLLGAVWSPCIGPTLGGAIALASQGGSLLAAGAVMFAFSLGISTIMLALAYGARETIRARQDMLRRFAARARTITGIVFVVVGVAIWFKVHRILEFWLLSAMPVWLQNLSVSI